LSKLKALSPSGDCAPFDARTDGMVLGEGASALVLKPLERALADGDDPTSVVPRVEYSSAPGGLTGNNVNLADTTVSAVNTQLAYELAVRATGDRFSLYRSAVRGA